jgi:hypothetical protein
MHGLEWRLVEVCLGLNCYVVAIHLCLWSQSAFDQYDEVNLISNPFNLKVVAQND